MAERDEPLIEVPDDFDLHEALNADTSTDEEDLLRCPDCGSQVWAPKAHHEKGPDAQRKTGRYRCKTCGNHFHGGDR